MSNNLSLQAGLAAAATTYTTGFNEFYQTQLPGAYQAWTEVITGNTMNLDLRWVSNTAQMRKWLGSRVEKSMRVYGTSYKLEAWEATHVIKRMDLEYEGNLNVIGRGIDGFLKSTLVAYDQAVSSVADSASGAGPTAFDGVALYSASHPYGPAGANQSNLAAATNLSWTTFDAARQAMTELRHENGEPCYVRPTHMRVGPKLERRAKEILEAKDRMVFTNVFATETTTAVQNATAFPNVWAGELTLIVDPRITNYYWDLYDLSKPGVRPYVLYEGRKPQAINMIDMSSTRRFYQDEFVFGLEGDYVVGAGMWQVAYRGTGTA